MKNELNINLIEKFQSLDVGAQVLWRAFGLTEISHPFVMKIDKF
jgi:hypothetical protein